MRPYHDPSDINYGGPHDAAAFTTDNDNGRMDGFIRSRESCQNALDPQDCIATLTVDMMGYHNQHEIPNYWAYARHFVLQDHCLSRLPPGACQPTCTSCPSGRHCA